MLGFYPEEKHKRRSPTWIMKSDDTDHHVCSSAEKQGSLCEPNTNPGGKYECNLSLNSH